jgi:SAM-dependent methyltransferase
MVDMIPRTPHGLLIDVGSGTGEGTLRLAQHVGSDSHILGIDPSVVQTEFAGMRIPPEAQVKFSPYSVEEAVDRFPGVFDGVVAFNSIHLLGKTQKALAQLASLVNPGGFVAFCTGYTTESMSFTEKRSAAEMFEVMQNLAAEFGHTMDAASRESDGQRIRSVRMKALPGLLEAAGLDPGAIVRRTVAIPAESLVDFLALPGMAASFLPKSLSTEEVRQIISQAIEQCNITSVSRTWCFVVAKCRETSAPQ